MPAGGAAHHVVKPVQVAFHGAHLGQAVECAHHEEGVAQPAITVIPVAPAVRRLGNAGGHGGDDRAGFLVLAELEGDGRADHGVLPLQRHRQAARPVPPVQRGLFLELARRLVDAAGQRLVGPEQQADGRLEREPGSVDQVGQRHAGVQAHGEPRQVVAQVVAAPGQGRWRGAPVPAGPHHEAHPWVSGQRAHPAHQLSGPEHAVAVQEAWREIDQLDPAAVVVPHPGAHDRGAGVVGLLDPGQSFELDAHGAIQRQPLAAAQERIEHR
jgi:hypothetical protein